MRHFLLIFTLLIVRQNCIAQDSIPHGDLVSTTIPKHDLIFRNINAQSSHILANAINQISTNAGDDSVYVYQNGRNSAFMIFGNDSSYQLVDLQVSQRFDPDYLNFQYSFSFDSLGTNTEYLILNWFGRNYREHSTHSGSEEFICNQTINEYVSIERGVTIISLMSKKILFQGITEIKVRESQTKNPGGQKREIKNEKITRVQFLQNNDYLNLFNHGYEDYDYWNLYENLSFGIYQIIDDQYVLIVKK